ncbi:AAA family ATPase [Lutibacter flavus]|uniref:AAA domain-containing protein, putative AbiEii toxin, Type IV TA system n=1 Tax=Lutibacter flavus TaxID=691689 RepID=A0A238YY67_9FLAO|nr:ATP-binding protein [Lutibacter flavus]SNR75459.1 AAA domain-containing protein, putative AbiEii toxin, Type IV TA system [Lutibacter flavus]
MKLIYQADYISIKSFNPIVIDDFSILSGINGSGKTHLLKAIDTGRVVIGGIDKSEIVYYNYNDFSVITENSETNPAIKQRLNNARGERGILNNMVGKLKNTATINAQSNLSENDKVIYGFANRRNYNFENQFGKKYDYDLLNELKQELNFRDNLESFKERFSPDFFEFIFRYLQNVSGDVNDLKIELLKPRFEKISLLFDIEFKKVDEEMYYFLKNSVNNKNIFNINGNDYETPIFILEDIANEEKNYQFLKANNSLNKVKKLEWGENVEYLDKVDFEKKYGKSPIEEINAVLEEYDCNGYFLNSNKIQPQLGVDKAKVNISVILEHRKAKYETHFQQLSSGEKTLIALSLLIYKSNKNKVMPRVLLLDEIDSSLHPKMIKRLLTVIQELFIKKKGLKIILATHSPSTIAFSPNNSIYIVNKSKKNIIEKRDKSFVLGQLTEGFVTINNENTNLSIEYNISRTNLPVLFTEGITDKIIIEIAWRKLYGDQEMPFYIQDCYSASFLGSLFRNGDNLGDGIFANHPDKILISLFDFDTAGYNYWNGLSKKLPNVLEENPLKCLTKENVSKNGYSLLLPVPENPEIKKQVIKNGNITFKDKSELTIELMFFGVEQMESFFIKQSIVGGGEIVQFRGDKKDFANKIKNLSKEDFDSFLPLFLKISEILDIKR